MNVEDFLKYGDMYYDRFMVTQDLKYLEEAKYYFEKALPHKAAQLRLYIIYRILGEDAKAQELYEKMEKPYQLYLDALIVREDDPFKAMELLEHALEYNPDFPEFYLYYSSLLMEMGQYEKGLEILKKGMEKHPFVELVYKTYLKFKNAKNLRMLEITLGLDGTIKNRNEYGVSLGWDLLTSSWAGREGDSIIVRVPEDKELREIVIDMLYHTPRDFPREYLLKLKDV